MIIMAVWLNAHSQRVQRSLCHLELLVLNRYAEPFPQGCEVESGVCIKGRLPDNNKFLRILRSRPEALDTPNDSIWCRRVDWIRSHCSGFSGVHVVGH